MSFKINNKRGLAVIVSCAIIICNFYACKKSNSSSGVTHVITYKLTGSIYTPFNNISYTDSLGIQESASAADSTIGWSKVVTEHYSNFPVMLEVQGQNSSSSQLTYTLEIIVDGTSRAKQQYSTAAFNSFDSQVSTLIQ
jgi:hypothetical protein